MRLRLQKSWQPLTEAAIEQLPAQLGVYQVAEQTADQTADQGRIVSIGYAGAREPFGMQSALRGELHAAGASTAENLQFRCEFTSNYRSRHDELLMLHLADHGELPDRQSHHAQRIGRLDPA